eukprot:2264604-Prymnesium_polylepis.1
MVVTQAFLAGDELHLWLSSDVLHRGASLLALCAAHVRPQLPAHVRQGDDVATPVHGRALRAAEDAATKAGCPPRGEWSGPHLLRLAVVPHDWAGHVPPLPRLHAAARSHLLREVMHSCGRPRLPR